MPYLIPLLFLCVLIVVAHAASLMRGTNGGNTPFASHGCNDPVPAVASAAGLTHEIFCFGRGTLPDIDDANNKAPGHDLYWNNGYGYQTLGRGADYTVDGTGAITLRATASASGNWGLQTCAMNRTTNGGSPDYNVTDAWIYPTIRRSFTGSYYLAASISYNAGGSTPPRKASMWGCTNPGPVCPGPPTRGYEFDNPDAFAFARRWVLWDGGVPGGGITTTGSPDAGQLVESHHIFGGIITPTTISWTDGDDHLSPGTDNSSITGGNTFPPPGPGAASAADISSRELCVGFAVTDLYSITANWMAVFGP